MQSFNEYLIQDIKTGTVQAVPLERLLEIINDPKDTSEHWTNYTESDWRDGWNEWAEGDIYTLITTAG
jgi:hypothetical protein